MPGSGLSECWAGPSLEVGGVPVRQVCCLSTKELGKALKTPEMFCCQDAGADPKPCGDRCQRCLNVCDSVVDPK